MRKKQVIAMVLSAVLAAGSNMTAVTTLAAVCDPQAAGGSPVRSAGAGRDVLWSSAEGDEEDSGDSIDLEKAVTEAVSQVSGGASKEETVYIFTDEYGNQRDITVSNWLKNPEGKDKLEDLSDLSDIENVKGDETYDRNGEEITWNAGGKDIYYQGTTTQQPPVSEKITYYLDGREIAAKDLAGKSGKVRIRIEYTNNVPYKNVYVPFAAVSGMAFSNDTATNIDVDNGSVISEGKNTIVVGMAFPGLQESLNTVRSESKDIVEKIGDDEEDKQDTKNRIDEVDIPGSVEITMDATDFKMSTCMTMVFSNLFTMDEEDERDFDEDHSDVFSDMDDAVTDLEDDGNDLADGTQDLVDGVEEARDGVDELSDGVGELADGVEEYTDGVDKVDDGAYTLAKGAKTLTGNNKTLRKGVKGLVDGSAKLAEGAAAAAKGSSDLAGGVKKYTAGADQAADGAGSRQADRERQRPEWRHLGSHFRRKDDRGRDDCAQRRAQGARRQALCLYRSRCLRERRTRRKQRRGADAPGRRCGAGG